MNPNDLIFLGLRSQVIALSKSNGEIRWSMKLPGVMGEGFVTVNSDGACVYAFTKGRIHCLDMVTGRILWTNELKGFGYGIASICVPGFSTAPDPAAYAEHKANERSRDAAASTGV